MGTGNWEQKTTEKTIKTNNGREKYMKMMNMKKYETKGKKAEGFKSKMDKALIWIRYQALRTDEGIDGILVTVGLCIIALLLCVVMKNSLSDFITSMVTSMTKEASAILKGTRS